eukprot:CAMPEP_0170482696 /NCGR_PEP_ID=MMETSP0208-20121228/2599_1 /TAXON_ID=197538 /ORGANISM="Strombidium inclinatum, Strain S3" /LENGTH=109 /DNA_ID=CAMNT_0010755559 /DNA_START=353 /DNA_END=682 /DNA_ORIENTATION=+
MPALGVGSLPVGEAARSKVLVDVEVWELHFQTVLLQFELVVFADHCLDVLVALLLDVVADLEVGGAHPLAVRSLLAFIGTPSNQIRVRIELARANRNDVWAVGHEVLES